MDLTHIYRLSHTFEECILLSRHRTFSKEEEHTLGHKESLNKYKKIEIMSYTLSEHNAIKLEINNKKNYVKFPNICRLDN
jgi:hypothetical protein